MDILPIEIINRIVGESYILYTILRVASKRYYTYTCDDSKYFDRLFTPDYYNQSGVIEYKLHGRLHKLNGPAYTTFCGEYYYKYGLLHRINGPAINIRDTRNSVQLYYTNGKLHRDGLPAIVSWGLYVWSRHGKLHREDGPAIVYVRSKYNTVDPRDYELTKNFAELIVYMKSDIIVGYYNGTCIDLCCYNFDQYDLYASNELRPSYYMMKLLRDEFECIKN